MNRIVLGTAGHIDHGKTSLVKLLTGTDTDRLKEEKERGITIDLGFAYMTLPSGTVAGIVDVPGHERFVKNMVAGAAGIDMVMLVIAADDGVMPQTREHLDICSFLGIRHGLVAVTKTDLVDGDLLSMALEEISGYLKGTFLEGAPVVPVSSVTGKGMDDLISSIDSVAGTITRRKTEGFFRMPVDRSFSIKGFGTVITGTPVSGRVRVGDEVEILPQKLRTRVRGLQTHGAQVQEGAAGSRVAVNLQGVEREAVKRGDTAATPGILDTADRFEAEISLLPSAPRPLKDGAEPMLHIYSSSSIARISVLDMKAVRPGEKAFVRIRSRYPLVAMHGDRFVIRSSDSGTIGGGVFLDPNPPKRNRRQALDEMKILATDNIEGKAYLYIKRAGASGCSIHSISMRLGADPSLIKTAVAALIKSGEILKLDEGLISVEAVKPLKEAVLSLLGDFHRSEPMKEGMPKDDIRARLSIPPRLMGIIMDGLITEKVVVSEKEFIRLASHKASGGETKGKIERIYIDAGFTPPILSELLEKLKIREREALDLSHQLVKEGKLVKVKELFFSKATVDGLQTRVVEFLKAKGEMSPVDFKELTGLSRKFAIPLLEYLDSQKITIRVGEVRKLRKG